jgi:hypothetical protein
MDGDNAENAMSALGHFQPFRHSLAEWQVLGVKQPFGKPISAVPG